MRNSTGKRTRLLVVAMSLLALAGCRQGVEQRTAVPGGTGAQEQSAPLLVLEGPGGSTLALAPVFINGEGPFAFALDTGASQSVIDQGLAEELNLPTDGPTVEVSGVAATAEAEQVRVHGWAVGDVQLPGRTMVSLVLREPNRRLKLRGLLGSDVLSQFGTITVDYDRQRLLFRARP
jgi:hypothetical protein